MRTAALLPAYQAAASVAAVVRGTLEHASLVVVVDDGSRDRTSWEAERAGATVLRHERNEGKGRALGTGFAFLRARGVESIATLDADGQHRPDQLPLLLAAAAGADLVLGTRLGAFAGMSRTRRVANRLSSRAISAFAGLPLEDAQSGFRVYSARLIDRLGMPEPGFEAESAVLVRAARAGLRIACVPVELGFADGRATSHYRPLIDSFRIAGAVLRAHWQAPR